MSPYNRIARRNARSLLAMSLTIAVVGVFLVHWFLNTRDEDLRRLNCGIVSRQVSGIRLTLDQSRFFRDNDDSAAVRGYFEKIIPIREKTLAGAVSDQARLHCVKDAR